MEVKKYNLGVVVTPGILHRTVISKEISVLFLRSF